jgi:ABC-type nitrate/sulfonate/bicarbonate transport system substrate-binding protein
MPGNVALTALSTGEIQFISSPTDSIIGLVNGFPYKIVYSAWDSSPWALVGKQELAGLADMRGKTIATNRPGTAPYAFLEAGLKRTGMTIADVSILFVNGTEYAYLALAAGQVDGAVVTPPFDVQAEQNGWHTIASLGEYLQVPYIGLATSTRYLEEHRDVVVNAIKGMMDAEAWIRANPDGSAALISKYVNVSPEVAQQAYAKMVGRLTQSGEVPLEGIAQQMRVLEAVVNHPVDLDPRSAVDFGPLASARGR